MEDVLKIASYISQRYLDEFGARIDEKKLHILLYFMQRECLAQTGNPLFDESFCAQSFGPFLMKVHTAYVKEELSLVLEESPFGSFQPVIEKVYVSLASKKARSLVSLIHGEYSWRKAFEKGVGSAIRVEDIKHDANRFKVRCFLLNNLDEFRNSVYA